MITILHFKQKNTRYLRKRSLQNSMVIRPLKQSVSRSWNQNNIKRAWQLSIQSCHLASPIHINTESRRFKILTTLIMSASMTCLWSAVTIKINRTMETKKTATVLRTLSVKYYLPPCPLYKLRPSQPWCMKVCLLVSLDTVYLTRWTLSHRQTEIIASNSLRMRFRNVWDN